MKSLKMFLRGQFFKKLLFSAIIFLSFNFTFSSNPVPFKSIKINGKIIKNDSIDLIKANLKIQYCDSLGSICDSSSYYLISYKKFRFIYYPNCLKNDTLKVCDIYIELNKIDKFYSTVKFTQKQKNEILILSLNKCKFHFNRPIRLNELIIISPCG